MAHQLLPILHKKAWQVFNVGFFLANIKFYVLKLEVLLKNLYQAPCQTYRLQGVEL